MQTSNRSIESVVVEREALEELVRSKGWEIFVLRTLEEYTGRGYMARMGPALEQGEVFAKALHQTSVEIERALKWVHNRIDELKGVKDNES